MKKLTVMFLALAMLLATLSGGRLLKPLSGKPSTSGICGPAWKPRAWNKLR